MIVIMPIHAAYFRHSVQLILVVMTTNRVLLTTQEKRKIPPVPNGVTDLGESEEHGGHGGPELQRTGR